MDYRQVRDFKNKNSNANEINLNIKPVVIDNLVTCVAINKIITNIPHDNNQSSDSDTSIQVKCCTNMFTW